MFQFSPEGLTKYRINPKQRVISPSDVDTPALCLIATVDVPESVLIFDSLVCDLAPNPRPLPSRLWSLLVCDLEVRMPVLRACAVSLSAMLCLCLSIG